MDMDISMEVSSRCRLEPDVLQEDPELEMLLVEKHARIEMLERVSDMSDARGIPPPPGVPRPPPTWACIHVVSILPASRSAPDADIGSGIFLFPVIFPPLKPAWPFFVVPAG